MIATNCENGKSDDIYSKFEVFGRYQFLQYTLVCLTLFMTSMSHINYVFVAENVDYRCRVPLCENASLTVNVPSWWPDDTDSKCFQPILNKEKYDLDNQTCSNTTFYNILEDCQSWIYENNNSIVAELNLACQPWKVSSVGAVHNGGMLVSMLFAGWIADKIGRKPTAIVCAVGASVGVIKIFMRDYNAYIVVEFLESFLGSGLYTVGVVLLIEVGGRSKRVLTGVIFSYAVYSGEVVFAFIVMGLRYWKWVVLAVYSPMLLFGVYVFVLRESTRWEMLRGKMENAKRTLVIKAKMNQIDIAEKVIMDSNDAELRLKFDVQEQKEKENIKEIFASKEIMKRVAVTSFCFFSSSFLYYGTVVHSVLLPGNKYTNFILSALASFPGDVIAFFMMNKFGRRISLQCGYLVSAVFLVAQCYAPDSLSWLKLVLFLGAKLGVVVCFTGIYTYSLELFPTSVRGSLFGLGNTAARVGSILAPLTPLLITESTALPSILFATSAVVAAVLVLLTPETKNLPMFDTIAQVEFAKTSSITKL